jgi:alpha-1,2-mannosyltransferase
VTTRRVSRNLVILGALAALMWVVVMVTNLGPEATHGLDLRVYRVGGSAWWHGVPLYDGVFPAPLSGPALPFTYPPLAAVLFVGLAAVSWWPAVVLITVAGVAAAWLTVRLAARSAVRDPRLVLPLTLGVLAVAAWLEPVRQTLYFGQVNLLLMAAVALDCLAPRTRLPRGVLIGLVAAIKLTPLVFLLFFVARRQWRPVAAAGATFAAAGLVGWWLAPADSAAYWFGALSDPSRIGGAFYGSNQSLRGVLARLELPAEAQSLTWVVLAALVLGAALLGVRRLRERGDGLGALLVTAAAELLVSPVSWSHHWVWAAPALVWLAVRTWRRSGPVLLASSARVTAAVTALLPPVPAPVILPPLTLPPLAQPDGGHTAAAERGPGPAGTRRAWLTAGAGALVVLVFCTGPHWLAFGQESVEVRWAGWRQLLGDAYAWLALLAVVLAAVPAFTDRRRPVGAGTTG